MTGGGKHGEARTERTRLRNEATYVRSNGKEYEGLLIRRQEKGKKGWESDTAGNALYVCSKGKRKVRSYRVKRHIRGEGGDQ